MGTDVFVLFFPLSSITCPKCGKKKKLPSYMLYSFLYTKSPMMFIQSRVHPLFMKLPTKTFLGCPPVNFLHKLLPFLYLCSDINCWLKKETSFHCQVQVSCDPSFVLIIFTFPKVLTFR